MNNDPSVEKISVILNSHTGDADIFGSRLNKTAEEGEDIISSQRDVSRELIEFVKQH